MPEDLGDGLYLALMGMGLVFLSLVVFMLILLALGKLFPGEEVAEAINIDEDPVATAIREMEVQEELASDERALAESQWSSTALGGPADGSISGAKIAAMAVALYLATEQDEHVANTTVVPSAWNPAQNYSGWNATSRASQWENQGRRPLAYGQRSQTAYPHRSRLRE